MKTMPALPVDPFTDDILRDPTEFWRELRASGPVVKVQQAQGHDIVAAGRFSAVRQMFQDNENFLNSTGGGILDLTKVENFREPQPLQETDAPYHTNVRSMMSAIVSPRNLRKLRDYFQQTADELVDHVLELGEFDAQVELAEAYPLKVIPDTVIGLRPDSRENLLRYSTFVFESFGPRTPRAAAVLAEIDVEATVRWAEDSCRQDMVSPGTFGSAIWDLFEEGKVTREEAHLLVRSFVTAGVDTTVHAIGFTLHQLASNPTQWAKLHATPDLGKFAFEEGLRWGTPVRQIWRTAARDIEVDGVDVREGQKIMLVQGAANHDPDEWGPTADSFEIDRENGHQLSFGRGIHTCLGAPIARMEGDILFSTFARKVKTIELAGEPVPFLNNTIRGFASLPIRITAA
jgi:4-methoxybenzoate monooxygenase (O-demethylating)